MIALIAKSVQRRKRMVNTGLGANQDVILSLLIDRGITKELRRLRCKAGNVERIKRKHNKNQAKIIGYDVEPT